MADLEQQVPTVAIPTPIYIAGPMTNVPYFNYPAFHAAAATLRSLGYEVRNPAERGLIERASWELWMRLALQDMLDCAYVCLLAGWGQSRGAKIEIRLASDLAMPIFRLQDRELVPFTETCLEEAARLVDGDRERSYGHPKEDFARIVGQINALFPDKITVPLEAHDWPLIMNCAKMSRERNRASRENRTDGCGYWRTLERIYDEL